jgi:hypothetical protein
MAGPPRIEFENALYHNQKINGSRPEKPLA